MYADNGLAWSIRACMRYAGKTLPPQYIHLILVDKFNTFPSSPRYPPVGKPFRYLDSPDYLLRLPTCLLFLLRSSLSDSPSTVSPCLSESKTASTPTKLVGSDGRKNPRFEDLDLMSILHLCSRRPVSSPSLPRLMILLAPSISTYAIVNPTAVGVDTTAEQNLLARLR